MSKMILDKNEILVISQFSENYFGKIYGRGIAKKLDMNQKTVSNILGKLEDDKMLASEFEGRNKYYSLNKFNSFIKEIIEIVEINRKIKFLDRNKKIKSLFEKIGVRSEGVVIVFGSYAKGLERKDSDLDLFVMGIIEDLEDLEDSYSLKINIVKASEEKLNKNSNFFREIMANHIILKGVEKFSEIIW